MPVVRDMTAGERTLLYNFLDGVELAATLAAAPAEDARPKEKAAPATGLAAMSRSMR
jgi:hypothetical protein